jgi:16S rRNA (guanine(966)-N(2))-methyltransferase RsmD
VKQKIFDILSPTLPGTSVLDLFAGAGSLGLEALSRGAEAAVFVESSATCARLIAKNIALCGFEKQARILRVPVMKALRIHSLEEHHFDLALIDPPYDQGLIGPTLARLGETEILGNPSQAVVEHSSREKPLAIYGFLVLRDQRRVGQTWISFYSRS